MGRAMGLAQQFPTTHLGANEARAGFREKCVNTQLKVKQQAERFTQPETKRGNRHDYICPPAFPPAWLACSLLTTLQLALNLEVTAPARHDGARDATPGS